MNRKLDIPILKKVDSRKVSDSGGQREYSKISVEAYPSRKRFIKEKNSLFKEFPLIIRFYLEIINHRDYIVHKLSTTPIIVIKNKDMCLIHVLRFYPKDEEHCTFISGTLVDNLLHIKKNELFWEQQYNYYWEALYKNIEIGKSIQTSIESKADIHFVYRTCKDLLYKFHKTVEEVINGKYSLKDAKKTIHESLTL